MTECEAIYQLLQVLIAYLIGRDLLPLGMKKLLKNKEKGP